MRLIECLFVYVAVRDTSQWFFFHIENITLFLIIQTDTIMKMFYFVFLIFLDSIYCHCHGRVVFLSLLDETIENLSGLLIKNVQSFKILFLSQKISIEVF